MTPSRAGSVIRDLQWKVLEFHRLAADTELAAAMRKTVLVCRLSLLLLIPLLPTLGIRQEQFLGIDAQCFADP
jgi:hypothetical protein